MGSTPGVPQARWSEDGCTRRLYVQLTETTFGRRCRPGGGDANESLPEDRVEAVHSQVARIYQLGEAPDMVVSIQPQDILSLLGRQPGSAAPVLKALNSALTTESWPAAVPTECKTRLGRSERRPTEALRQLVAYWDRVPSMAGVGFFSQVDVLPETVVNVQMLIPQRGRSHDILQAVRRLDPDRLTMPQFYQMTRGMVL